MKKMYAIIMILVLFAFGSLFGIGANIYAQRDQVTIRENVLYGDAAVADGLTVGLRNQMSSHLFWNTTYKVGKNSKCKTEYSFSLREREESEDYIYRGIDLYEYMESDFSYESGLGNTVGLSLIQKDYLKVLSKMGEGEEKWLKLYLKDYYEYYPVRMVLELPNTVWVNNNPETEVGDKPYDPKYVIEKFQKFFRIPVLESDFIQVKLTKKGTAEDGTYHNTTMAGVYERSQFHLDTVNVYTEDTCYFAIKNRKQQEKTLNYDDVTFLEKEYVDTSYIPGGYGIYAFSYGRGDGEYHTGIDSDSLKMVFPLEEKALVKHMMIRNNQSQLILITDEEQDAYLTVIDLATMKQTQKFLLHENLYDTEFYAEYFVADDFIAILIRGKIFVISEENGVYTHEFTVEEDRKLENDWSYLGRAMDFDGEKLAVVGNVYGRMGYVSQTCDFYLAVYDKNGLIYYGEYENSLSMSNNSNSYLQCTPNSVDTYTIKWENVTKTVKK